MCPLCKVETSAWCSAKYRYRNGRVPIPESGSDACRVLTSHDQLGINALVNSRELGIDYAPIGVLYESTISKALRWDTAAI
jgi:hypothetical protein